MESVLSILGSIFCVWFGWTVVSWVLRPLKTATAELEETMQDLEHQRLIALTIEVDQDTYFCYNSITKEFVCQGRDIQEIVKNFVQRYPGRQVAIFDGDESAVITLKQQMEQINKNERHRLQP